MISRLLTVRPLGAAGSAICVLALAIAYFFMERYLLLEPCPLCILDRIVVGVMAVIFLSHALVGAGRRKVHFGLAIGNLVALAFGFVFAFRHVYLQNRPPEEMPVDCLADSDAARGLIEIVERAFDANADCGVIAWEFLGLSIPMQVVLLFVVLADIVGLQIKALLDAGKKAAAA